MDKLNNMQEQMDNISEKKDGNFKNQNKYDSVTDMNNDFNGF